MKLTMELKIISISTLLFLSGCATLSEEQCLSGNWQAIGHNDGIEGRYPERINQHQKACAQTGVIPNFQAWQEGRQKGLLHYCTDSNAKRLGESGKRLNAVCPTDQANRLQRINNNAYERYQKKQNIITDERDLRVYQEKLRRLRSGEMLGFKSEIEAREHMLFLQKEIIKLEHQIRINKAFIY